MSSTNTICPRCGGKEFHEHEHQLSEENKNTYTKRLRCLKCNFEFEPST